MTVSRRSFLVGAAALMVSPPKIPAPAPVGAAYDSGWISPSEYRSALITMPRQNGKSVMTFNIVRANVARMFGVPIEKLDEMECLSVVQEYEDVVSYALRPRTKQFIESRDTTAMEEARKEWRALWDQGDWMKANTI